MKYRIKHTEPIQVANRCPKCYQFLNYYSKDEHYECPACWYGDYYSREQIGKPDFRNIYDAYRELLK